MKLRSFRSCALVLCMAGWALAQQQPNAVPGRGAAPPAGPQQDLKVVKDFDKDGDKRLNAEERKAAREFLAAQPPGRGSRALRPSTQPPPEPMKMATKIFQ